jgi:hypothetical protein
MIPFPITFWASPDGGITTTLPLASVYAGAPGFVAPVNISIDESLVFLDALTKTAISRTVVKTLAETILLAETIGLDRPLPLVSETLILIDALSVTPVSRTQIKTLAETILLAETITLTPEPLIASCTAVMGVLDGPCGVGRCCTNVTFSTGADCQSVQVQHQINGGSWVAWQNIDTSPSTGGYASSSRTVNDGDTVKWRVVPYSGDAQTGRVGTACETAIRTCGDL